MNRLATAGLLYLCLVGNALADEGAKKCDDHWRVRDSLSDTGTAKTPAKLSLEHSAGSDTFGTADVALLVDGACDAGVTNELEYDFGIDYHRNTSEKSPADNANVGGNLRYFWTRDQTANPDWILYKLFLSLSAGRNIEADTQTRALALSFESVKVGGDGFWLFGSDRERLTYSVQPRVEYFYGYQPKELDGARNTTYATVALSLDWVPMTLGTSGSTLHLFGSWTGRARIAGDSALPRSADVGSVGIELGFSSRPHESSSLQRRLGVALTYDVGKEPDSGFVHDEVVRLVFTYLFDT